jgi:uncharacterized protein YbbC (DUF1343 family)
MLHANKHLPLFILTLFFISCSSLPRYGFPTETRSHVETGLEQFLKVKAQDYAGKHAAVVTNHSGVDRNLGQNIDLLEKKGIIIDSIFAPEHGLFGYIDWPDTNRSEEDLGSGKKIYYLQDYSPATLRPLLQKFDFVLFDIQGMGMRCYTYISELSCIIDSLDGTGIEFVVLDRPNPLIPFGIDGIMLDKRFMTRTVSYFPSPTGYGLTPGEAALYYTHEKNRRIKLTVVPMKGYARDLYYSETSLPWIPPSPNLPAYKNAVIYSFIVYCEGINISVGRGTPNPFEYIGAPWINAKIFAKGLNALNLKGFAFRPVYFKPSSSNFSGQRCGGVQIFLTGEKFSACESAYKLISYLKNNHKEFKWQCNSSDEYGIDFLAGSDIFRKGINENISYDEIFNRSQKDRDLFKEKAEKYFLY